MRKAGRVVILFILSLFSTAVLSAVAAVMAAVSLAAVALIVPGTGTPNANDVENYLENFRDYYMQTPCEEGGGCADDDLEGVNYFASFWPIPLPGWCDPGRCEKFDDSVDDGVDNLGDALGVIQRSGYKGDVIIAGYSQGARVVNIAKMQFANGQYDEFLESLGEGGEVKFVYIGNPNRPNGGLLSRLGFLGTIPIVDVTTGEPTPTNTQFETEDWAIRWEGIADFPQYLFSPLAVVNSLLGFYYDHGTYLAINGGSDPGETPAGYTVEEWRAITSNPEAYPDIVDIQVHGDTTYYTITPKYLPLVRPLHSIPIVGKPIADLIEPLLRVIIEETGYDRSRSFGEPTELELFTPISSWARVLPQVLPALLLGINNMLANFGLATEIPLSPVVPVTPVSPLTQQQDEQSDEPEQTTLLSENEDSSAARLSVVQDNSGVEQQPAGGDETTTADETVANPVEAAKAKWEAAKAEREAKFEAAKAEREANWEAAKAARESAMQDLKDRLETAKAALGVKGDDTGTDVEADTTDAADSGDAAA